MVCLERAKLGFDLKLTPKIGSIHLFPGEAHQGDTVQPLSFCPFLFLFQCVIMYCILSLQS